MKKITDIIFILLFLISGCDPVTLETFQSASRASAGNSLKASQRKIVEPTFLMVTCVENELGQVCKPAAHAEVFK